MDLGYFWDIIDESWWPQLDSQAVELRQMLTKFPPAQLIAFQQHFDRLMAEADTLALQGAADVMNGGSSTEIFVDFRSWLIARGRDTFEEAVADPDSVAKLELTEKPFFKDFYLAAPEIYQTKKHCEMPRTATEAPGTPDVVKSPSTA